VVLDSLAVFVGELPVGMAYCTINPWEWVLSVPAIEIVPPATATALPCRLSVPGP
jgi:hypothetical protein